MQDAPRFQSQSNTTHPAGWAASAAAARVPGRGGDATQPAAPGRVSGMSTPPTLLPLPQPGETPVRVLTVAGSDSGGGAGLQADLRTMALLGVHGCTAVTAVTVQNTLGVTGVHEVPAGTVAAQVRAVVYDIGVGAVKTGMLASTPIITALAEVFAELGIGKGSHVPLVLDPVAASVTDDPLFTGSAQNALTRSLFPLATLLTPNLDEVRLFTGIDVVDGATQREAARVLHGLGPRWVLVKGGHLRTSPVSTDVLFDGQEFTELSAARVPTTDDHGAGDCLGAATACALAHGWDVAAAVALGKDWATRCVGAAYPLGSGHGPVSPLWRLRG